MLFKIEPREKQVLQLQPVEPTEAEAHTNDGSHVTQKEEPRRTMYERIAQGNALVEAEENARRKWHNQ